jgi:hypothetical protein
MVRRRCVTICGSYYHMEERMMPDTPERRPTDVAPPATRQGGSTMQSGSGQTNSGQSASEQVSQAGEQIKQQASNWAQDAKNRGRQMLDERKGSAAEQISGIARALKQSAETCRQDESQQTAGRLLDQAASGLEQVSDMLRSRDIDSMMQQATTLMRRQPAMFVGGAIAAGFLLSRFLKSSSEHTEHSEHYDEAYEARQSSYGGGPQYVTSAHVDPGEVAASNRTTDSTLPGGRDY